MPVELGDGELVVVVVETDEMVEDRDVAREETDEVEELDDDVKDERVPCCWYTFRRDPAPQY
jgi:hypothetical protein